MTAIDDFSAIFAKTPGRIKPGLERMQAALSQLGNPERNGRNVLVAGTNGKGTTSSFLWYLCQLSRSFENQGHKKPKTASLFSSPHLVQFKERFLYSGGKISHKDLKQQLSWLQEQLEERYEPLSFFEVATLLGMSLFDRLEVHERIWEVGLGGRWDCTNTVEPDLALIVSIGLDHQEFLGDTLEQVLSEKLGVARKDKPLLLGNCPNLRRPELLALCMNKASTVLRFGHDFGYTGDPQHSSRCFLRLPGHEPQEFELPETIQTKPRYLQDNFILALAAFKLWRGAAAPSPSALITCIRWPELWCLPGFFGRGQQVDIGGQQVLWDVCHNVAGARAFGQSLMSTNKSSKNKGSMKPPALVSILADKDIDGILTELAKALDIRAFYRIDHPRSPKSFTGKNGLEGISTFDSFAQAWNSRQSWLPAPADPQHQSAGHDAAPIVICGSVMAIGVAMAHLADESVEINSLWHFDRYIGTSATKPSSPSPI